MAERVRFRGGLTCSCVAESLPLVEAELQAKGIIAGPLRIFQLGYRGDVSASAGTHNRGGCIDVQLLAANGIDVFRRWGWTMQARFLSGVTPHCHGWPYRCPHLSEAAQDQERDWDRRDAGLQGSAQVTGRWPVRPWYEAIKAWHDALQEQQKSGVPLMADAKPINISDFPEDQPLSGTGRVWINKEKHATVVSGSSPAIDATAHVVVEGLQEGERVRFWWINEWKRDGQEDRSKGNRPPVSVVFNPADPAPGVQVDYRRGLAKADSGWTACLRLVYSTNSKTARITRREFDGWRMEA